MRTLALWLLAIILSALAATSLAADEPHDEIRIARLVKQLGSEIYNERKLANDELAELGSKARLQLEQASRSSDYEVRLRATELLRRLKIGDLWSATNVRCRIEQEAASKAIVSLVERTGNRILVGEPYGPFQDANVDLKVAEGPFWQVLDEICRQSDNHVRPHYETREPGLVVAAGSPGKHPLAYAGPLRAQITSARRVFIEELDYERMRSEINHTFQVNLQVMWEDRFQLVAYRNQPEVIEALTDTKVKLSGGQPAGNGWNVAGNNVRQLTASLRLNPPPVDARKLERLVMKWGLIAIGDLAAIDVEDLWTPSSYRQDDVELVIEEVEARPGGRYDLSVVVKRDLVVPEPEEIVFQECRVELFDAHGRTLRLERQSNTLSDQGARMRFTFVAETDENAPMFLRLTYPRLRSQQDVEITFRDVPLPGGRPE